MLYNKHELRKLSPLLMSSLEHRKTVAISSVDFRKTVKTKRNQKTKTKLYIDKNKETKKKKIEQLQLLKKARRKLKFTTRGQKLIKKMMMMLECFVNKNLFSLNTS